MRKLVTIVLGIFGLSAAAAFGQAPVDMLKGTWVAESRFCGKSIYVINRVDPDGAVYGSFTCTNTKWNPTLGKDIGKNAVRGTFVGNRFLMVNVDGGGNDLILNGNKLEGTGKVKGDTPPGQITFIKQ
jgi:hypothetical protein